MATECPSIGRCSALCFATDKICKLLLASSIAHKAAERRPHLVVVAAQQAVVGQQVEDDNAAGRQVVRLAQQLQRLR